MDIMAAIRKQAAMEVITEESTNEEDYLRWKCPACKEVYITARGAYDFCPKCGQKLLWKYIERTTDERLQGDRESRQGLSI